MNDAERAHESQVVHRLRTCPMSTKIGERDDELPMQSAKQDCLGGPRCSGAGCRCCRQLANLWAQQPPNSYAPVVMQEDFDKVVAKMSAAKARNHGPAHETAGGAVRLERSARPRRHDVAWQADSGGRAGEIARRREVVGRTGRHDARGRFARRGCGPRVSCPCRIPTIPKAAWCFPSTRSTRSRSRKDAT